MGNWKTKIFGDNYMILGARRKDNQELLIVVPVDSGLSEATAVWRGSNSVTEIGQAEIEHKKDVVDELEEQNKGGYEIKDGELEIHHSYFN